MQGSVKITVGRKSQVLWALNCRYNLGSSVEYKIMSTQLARGLWKGHTIG